MADNAEARAVRNDGNGNGDKIKEAPDLDPLKLLSRFKAKPALARRTDIVAT